MAPPRPIRPAPPASGQSYGRYLHLPELLSLQVPLSDAHDELLFIVIHQASELWVKLCLHELEAARRSIVDDRIPPALKMMTRVARVQAQLIQSWDVLATITPADYSLMRGSLGTSSGFQSHQYRLMEYMMGNKDARFVAVHDGDPAVQALLRAGLATPGIYDAAIDLLARRGFDIAAGVLERDVTQPYVAAPSVERAWGTIYGAPDCYWDLYELAEKLVDLEYRFQLWRFGHLKAIERIIGFKRGTGGTAGVPYLASVVNQVFFPELLDVRRAL